MTGVGNDSTVRTTLYAGDYERVTENGVTRHYYYLGNGAVYVRTQGGDDRVFYALTDHLGSIVRLIDENHNVVFDATYDAWGQQTVMTDSLGFRRGYTGHEMLPEFSLINMNGRLYDPLLGVFLSPDNYVQAPENSQSFNRYSYCLNNPLKYTDPSGELFGIDDAIIAFALYNAATSMMQAKAMGGNIWKAGGLSLLSSAASYGIGSLFGGMGTFGHELMRAGAHGLSSGIISGMDGGSFGSGFFSGALSSGIGSFAQGVHMGTELMVGSTTLMGGIASWATGGDFLSGAIQGMNIGLLNHEIHSDPARCRKIGKDLYQSPYNVDEVQVIGSYKLYLYSKAARTYGGISFGLQIMKGISQYIGKTRIGTNGKIYLPKANGQFYGNQYVKTKQLSTVKGLGKISSVYKIGEYYSGYEAALLADGNTIGENCKRYVAHVVGKEFGSIIGAWGGEFVGSSIGLYIGGYGAVPIGIAGYLAGDYAGGELGAWAGEYIYDSYLR